MELTAGFKRSDVGVIPEEWDVEPLESFTSFISYGFTNPMPTSTSGVYMVTAKDIDRGKIQYQSARYTTKSAYHELLTAKSKPIKGDVLLTKDGTLGRLAVVEDTTVCINQSVALLRPSARIHGPFLKCLLEAPAYQAKMFEEAGGSTIKHIYITIVNKMPIAVPKLRAEQEAIAEALADADAWIESLEKLIAKKRQIKLGVMHQLLTGKRRLPGFSGEWRKYRLGEIGEISGSGVDKLSRPDEVPVRLVNYMDVFRRGFIYSEQLSHYVTASAHQARRCAVKAGDVFFTPSSETRQDIALSSVAMEDIDDAVYSYHVVRLRLHADWDLRFRGYAFKTRAFLAHAETICDGSGTRYTISQPKFRQMTVTVPDRHEQAAIGEVVWELDAEIGSILSRLQKARHIKQGMMQNLLTGKVRLA